MILLAKESYAINSTLLSIKDSFTIVEQSMVPEITEVAEILHFLT